ncbi:hypothetical protein M595_3833 [Lyngbya aestuarii BL J]|uniref:Uncharacterized protein n=1 Tax=Lyngbya aestuarii BL J TaxID=1348334 RepID=U7QE75_9CYAN|nr:hypothetical protein M595_3833 [Lyngbya aestuarii BL J]
MSGLMGRTAVRLADELAGLNRYCYYSLSPHLPISPGTPSPPHPREPLTKLVNLS